jgi:histidinol-phosphate/aromatic aminotransferase/cobyric acid decarboxylase-like protein
MQFNHTTTLWRFGKAYIFIGRRAIGGLNAICRAVIVDQKILIPGPTFTSQSTNKKGTADCSTMPFFMQRFA